MEKTRETLMASFALSLGIAENHLCEEHFDPIAEAG
jgi:hypothetical protein